MEIHLSAVEEIAVQDLRCVSLESPQSDEPQQLVSEGASEGPVEMEKAAHPRTGGASELALVSITAEHNLSTAASVAP
jgi:hypothetical protein